MRQYSAAGGNLQRRRGGWAAKVGSLGAAGGCGRNELRLGRPIKLLFGGAFHYKHRLRMGRWPSG